MNFFGHVVVAGWFEDDPRYLFGSMLPDFASMSGTRLAHVGDTRVAAGVALHHRTDDAFHSAPAFVRLMAVAREELERRAVGWGTARAVAHVGTELLLDGALLQRHAAAPYLAALETAHALTRDASFGESFRDRGEGFRPLLARLREAGPPHAYESTDKVTGFLERALHRRPRLRFGPGDAQKVNEVLSLLHPEVQRETDGLMQHLRAHELLRPDGRRATTAP